MVRYEREGPHPFGTLTKSEFAQSKSQALNIPHIESNPYYRANVSPIQGVVNTIGYLAAYLLDLPQEKFQQEVENIMHGRFGKPNTISGALHQEAIPLSEGSEVTL